MIIRILTLLVLAVIEPGRALRCATTDGGSQLCSKPSEVCVVFTYFQSTFRGCMDRHTDHTINNCDSVKAFDPSACCCDFDECNKNSDCTITLPKERLLQASTSAPTTFALHGSEYCAVPISWTGASALSCDFGSENGWVYVNDTIIKPNLLGCVRVGDFAPANALGVLSENDRWCPTALNSNNAFDASTQDWGPCECSPCRIDPNAEPGGIVTFGLCDFGPESTWSYIFENGTKIDDLLKCVAVGDFPPLGYRDLGVDLNALWCPGALNGTSNYDVRNADMAISWGMCECASTPVPTASPSVSPSSQPSFDYIAEDQYCLIQNNTVAPIQSGTCNFGVNGTWDYLGADGMVESGLVGCVPVGLFPPRLEGAARAIDENALWCPSSNGLVAGYEYNIFDVATSVSWGVCECASCRIADQIAGNNRVTTGLCFFGDDDSSWTYIGLDGSVSSAVGCLSIKDFPPFGADPLLSSGALWCPGRNGRSHAGVYDARNATTRLNWGLCECLAPTDPPTEVDDYYSASPTVSTSKPTSAAPSTSPVKIAPRETPSPTTTDDALQTVCQIIETPEFSTSTAGQICGFGSGLWQFVSSDERSGWMSGCVSVGQFPPMGSEGVDAARLWCPGVNGLAANATYSADLSPDPFDWGLCECENCQIVITDDEFVGPVQSGACSFGPDRAWTYEPAEDPENAVQVVGCASIVELPPFPYTSETASSAFPPGTKWCPAKDGLTPSGAYSFVGLESDALQWGLCDCDETEPPTPETNSPVSAPTVFGQTRSPTKSPTRRPTTLFPSKSPTKSPFVLTPEPTRTPTCCQVVAGGPQSSGSCEFGPTGQWRYSAFGSIREGLSGCVSVDEFIPFGAGQELRNKGKRWCATTLPAGLVDSDTYEFTNVTTRSNWGVCECPCIPTPAPSSKAPSAPPTRLDRLALFIQADHSGSIRDANKHCRSQSNSKSTCWELLADFVRNLVLNVTESLGGTQKVRLYLSAFSCVNKNPTSKMMTDGLTQAGDWKAIDAALKKLKSLPDKSMYGTCPSLGAAQMIPVQQRLSLDWPIAYFVVTDGRVQPSDQKKYRKNVNKVKAQMAKRGRESVCVSTVGYTDYAEITRLLKTECVFPATDFIEIATASYSSQVANSILQATFSPTRAPGSPVFDGEPQPLNPPAESPADSQRGPSSTALTAGISLLVASVFTIAAVFIVVTRKRKRHVPKPHRQPDEVFWIANPSKPASPPKADGAAQPRRRSRASSEISFIDLPPPPPLPVVVRDATPSPPPPPPSPPSPAEMHFNEDSFSMSMVASPHPSLISSDDEEKSLTPARKSVKVGQGRDWKTQLSPFSSSGAKSLVRNTNEQQQTSLFSGAGRFDEFRATPTRPSYSRGSSQRASSDVVITVTEATAMSDARSASLSPLRSSIPRKRFDQRDEDESSLA